MERKFIPTLSVGNGYTYLKLQGVIDEDNLLANLISQIQGRLLIIEMALVERINSCGVRDWVNWLNQIQALGVQVVLVKCSPPIINQANMVTNFASEAFIHSFYAPYSHPNTGEEQSVLLFTEELRQTRPIQAPKIYGDDGEELEFEEFPESYFTFINDPRMMNYQMAADIKAVVDYFVPEARGQAPIVAKKPAPVQSSFSPQVRAVPVPTPQPQVRHEQPPLPNNQKHQQIAPMHSAPLGQAAYGNPSHQAPINSAAPPRPSQSSLGTPAHQTYQSPPPQQSYSNPPSFTAPSSSSAQNPAIAQQQELAKQQAILAQQELAKQQAILEQNKRSQVQQSQASLPENSAAPQKQNLSPHQATSAANAYSSPPTNDDSSKKMLKLLVAAIVLLLILLLILLLVIKFV